MSLPSNTVLNLSLTPALLCDRDFTILDFNRLFERVSGYGKDAKNNLSLEAVYPGHDLQALLSKLSPGLVTSCHMTLSDRGGMQHASPACWTLDDQGRVLLTLQVTDPDEANDLESHYQAFHDPLTNLPNRLLLDKRIESAIRDSQEHGWHTAILFVDLDEFKPINDTFGHICGDHVLITTAKRMLRQSRQDDTVARIGGDEFVLVCRGIQQPVHAGLTAKRLIRSLIRPIEWEDMQVQVSASVGISIAPEDGDIPEDLVRKADEAMYLAKQSGKNGYGFFDEDNYFL